MSKDYYKILGVEKNSSQDEIKRAYKKLAKQYHPDINKEPSAADKFKEINEAASVLGNAEKREHYDKFGTADSSGFEGGFGFDPRNFSGGFDFDDIFDNLFAGFGFGGRSRSKSNAQRGNDLSCEVEITLEDVSKGLTKKIELEKFDTCEDCNGTGAKKGSGKISCEKCNGKGVIQHTRRTPFGIFATTTTCSACQGVGEVIEDVCDECNGAGRVKASKSIDVRIPNGINNGTRLRVSGEGEAGERGGRAGDLYVDIFVKEHDVFKREGDDLFIDVPISFAQACIGGEVEVPTIDGKATIKVPPGTQPSTVLRMRGKGLPDLHGSGHGDQNVRVVVEVPSKLNKEQANLIKQFDDSLTKKKSWFF